MASILVTGGAGFIGSNLCSVLLEKGHTVCAVDNFITGRRENIATLLTNPNFSFKELDITDPAFLDSFEGMQIAYIYHLACPTGVKNLIPLAYEMLRTCSLGTLNVLELAKFHSAQLLFTSTAEMYGQPEKFPQDEHYTGNVDPIGPRSPYEEGKRFSESCVATYVRLYGLEAKIVRIFNTYGPGMSLRDTRVIPQFIASVINKEPLRIYGDGSHTRTHLFIDDQIRGLQLVMEKGIAGEVYNIGSEHPMTIKELAKLVISLSRHAADIVHEPHFIEDHRNRLPSVEKVKALGWTQLVPIERGLSAMLEYYTSPFSPAPKLVETLTTIDAAHEPSVAEKSW